MYIRDMMEVSTIYLIYTGSKYISTTIAMDKVLAKQILRSYNVLTSNYYIFNNEYGESMELNYPIVVKVSEGGLSIGVCSKVTE